MSDTRRREFFEALDAKLEKGAREHGDASFEKTAPALLAELEAEALDLAGWGYILWVRLGRLREVARAAESVVADAEELARGAHEHAERLMARAARLPAILLPPKRKRRRKR